MPKDFIPPVRMLYGIWPEEKPEPIVIKKSNNDDKHDHKHPEIEERLNRIEDMLKELLEK